MSYDPFDPSYNAPQPEEMQTQEYLPATISDVQNMGSELEEESFEPIREIDLSFNRNLIENLHSDVLRRMENDLIPKIEADFKVVLEANEVQAKKLELLGLKPEKLDEPFSGAFGGYDSTLLNSALLIYSKIISHLFPSTGIAHSQLLDDAEEELEEVGAALAAYYNYALLELDPTFIPEIKQAILWCILTGVIDTVTEVDLVSGRPYTKFIKPDRIALDGETCTIYGASRITVKTVLTEKEVEIRRDAGEFSGMQLIANSDKDNDEPYLVRAQEINNIEASISSDEKKLYSFWQVQTDLSPISVGDKESSTDDDEEMLPYRVAIHIESRKIVGIYRDWEKDVFPYSRIHRYSEFVYGTAIEKRGWGLLELAGNNAEIAKASLRQIINSNTMSTFGAGFYSQGEINNSDNSITYQPGAITPLNTRMGNIQDVVKMMQFPSPSPTTMEMLSLAQSKIEATAAISSSFSEPLAPNTAVAPYLEQAEQAGVLQSYILGNIYKGLQNIFDIMQRIYSTYFPEAPQEFMWSGKLYTISRQDFQKAIKVIPIADPSFTNKLQKRIVADTILKYAQQAPDLHNMYDVLYHVYETLDLTPEEINNIMPKQEETQPLDPVTENASMMTGGAASAGVWQDHQAHIVTHTTLLQDPSIDPSVAQIIQAHVAEHTALMYMVQMQQKLGFEMPEDPQQLDGQQQNQLAVAAATASQELLQEMQQQMAAAQPPEQAENEQAMKLMQMDIESKNSQAQLKIEMEGLKLQHKTQLDQFNNAVTLMEHRQQASIDNNKEELEVYKAQLNYIIKMHEIESKTGLEPLPVPPEPEVHPVDSSFEPEIPPVDPTMNMPEEIPSIPSEEPMEQPPMTEEEYYNNPMNNTEIIEQVPNNGLVDPQE